MFIFQLTLALLHRGYDMDVMPTPSQQETTTTITTRMPVSPIQSLPHLLYKRLVVLVLSAQSLFDEVLPLSLRQPPHVHLLQVNVLVTRGNHLLRLGCVVMRGMVGMTHPMRIEQCCVDLLFEWELPKG